MAVLVYFVSEVVPAPAFQCECDPKINIITAVKILAEIGDIRRFPNKDKLAQFAGIAPIKLSSYGKGER
ncbi:MAG: transposase [Acetivibrio ethanolgignens]